MGLQFMIEKTGRLASGLASGCQQAIELLKTTDFDAAILDFNLADGTSASVAETLFARKIPFIFYTGGGVPEPVLARLPGVLVLQKPCLPATIVRTLQELI